LGSEFNPNPQTGLSVRDATSAWLRSLNRVLERSESPRRSDWKHYVSYLVALAGDPEEQKRQGFDELTSGWAIGTIGWKRALAREYSHLKIDVGLSAGGVRELNEARWCDALAKAFRDCGRGEPDIAQTPPSTPWKIAIAAKLRREAAAPYSWIARKLNLGNLNTLRSNVRRWQLLHHALA